MKAKRIGLFGLILMCLGLAACALMEDPETVRNGQMTQTEHGTDGTDEIGGYDGSDESGIGAREGSVLKEVPPADRLLRTYGRLYRGTNDTGPMGDAGSVSGTITSTVTDGSVPTEDGQTNFGAVGNQYTWDSGDGFIMVFIDDEWYCFYEEKQEELTGRYCAFVRRIYGDAIYVDLAEYLTDEDTERMAELGVTEHDMPDGYYIYNPQEDLTMLHLDGDTSYSFIDWKWNFVKPSDPSNRYTTTIKTDFQKYLDTYTDSTPGMPFFFTLEDGIVQEIYEEPMA